MSHQFINKSLDYDSSGPRPSVPGKEDNRKYKMTDSAQSDHHPFTSSSSSSRSSSSPTCLKWARKLTFLLEDRDGVELFKKYVEAEGGIHSDRLNFYFACEGLKQQNEAEKVKQIIGAIYRFLKKSQLQVPDDIKQTIKAGLKDKGFILTSDLFDQMQLDVENFISETTYRNFLQSETYLQYVGNFYSAIERNQTGVSNISPANLTSAVASSMPEGSTIFLSRSSTLPTLHEEGDGTNPEEGAVGGFPESSNRVPLIGGSSSNSKVPMSLTLDALIATQQRRLEMRPPGTHGYSAYNAISYNPVSRRDSEMASMSSGRTDSDTMSISSNVADGRSQRKHHSRHQNTTTNIETESSFIIPRTQQVDPSTKLLTPALFYLELTARLELLKKDQDGYALLGQKLEKDQTERLINDAIQRKLGIVDDKNDQDILDEHVSRVWSDRTPQRTPGNVSPRNLLQRRRPETTTLGIGSSSTQSPMRTSRTLPDSNMRKFSKWGSMNTDSGISLFYDTTMKNRDAMSISGSSSTGSTSRAHRSQMLPPEVPISKSIQQLDDPRSRIKRHHPQPPLPQKYVVPPPLPAKNLSQPSPVATTSFAPNTLIEQTTTVVYSFCDEEVPYRIKIPGLHTPTLKQFKDYLPKKGNYRFFFKTRCDDEENPIIQEEICNDAEVLPLFEGKVMATVKPAN